MKKVLSVLLVLGMLLSIGFASDAVTKIPKKSASQNFVESIDSYLHYELINPATSKEFKDQINFFLNEREKTGNFRFDLMPSGKVFIISGKAILKIENENFVDDLSSQKFVQGDPIGPIMLPPGMDPSSEHGGGGSLGNIDVPNPKVICEKAWDKVKQIFTWVCKKVTENHQTGNHHTDNNSHGDLHQPVSRTIKKVDNN